MTDKVTPCVLPWTSFATNPFGKSRPCGYSVLKSKKSIETSTISQEFNGEIFRTIRQDFLKGQWPKNCERCRYMEQSKTTPSKKSMEQARFPQVHDLLSRTTSDGRVDYFPKEIDIRLGTICNLKCIHCGTGNSSKWLEDRELLGKYENLKISEADNSWVDHETPMWKDILQHLFEIEKFNFIGGEPFASKQHNRFIEKVARTPYAENISLHYVTNGTLLNEHLIAVLKNFKHVTINISLDATGDVLEFFRFPIKAPALEKTLLRFEQDLTGVFDLRLQWTSSNISIYYLTETLNYHARHFEKTQFRFCNFVDYPGHMSPQTLPAALKDKITRQLTPYLDQYPAIDFYLSQMNEKDQWTSHGETFINYLNDLSRVRGLNWRDKMPALSQELGN